MTPLAVVSPVMMFVICPPPPVHVHSCSIGHVPTSVNVSSGELDVPLNPLPVDVVLSSTICQIVAAAAVIVMVVRT